VGIIWATLTSLTAVIVEGALCAPPSGEAFDSPTLVTRCSHENTWAAVQGAFNAALDFSIFYLPIPVGWKLQLKTHRKIGVLSTFHDGSHVLFPQPRFTDKSADLCDILQCLHLQRLE